MSDVDIFARVVSGLSIVIALGTAWLTLLRRGTVRMTRPAFVSFQYDWMDNRPLAKVCIRGLLYSTAKRGQVIETLFVTLRRGSTGHVFSVWGIAEDKNIVRGSGLFVAETGVSAYHHFNPSRKSDFPRFMPGEYELVVHATVVGGGPIKLVSVKLTVPECAEQELLKNNSGVWFDWDPSRQEYTATLVSGPG